MRRYEEPEVLFLNLSTCDCIQSSGGVSFGGQGNDTDITIDGGSLGF